jgi:NAD(P)H-flavin reductase
VSTDTLTPKPVRVLRCRQETADTATLWLERGSFTGAPGQFNMLSLPGVGEVPISLSGLDEEGMLMHTVRSVGAVSRGLAALKENATVGVRGPFGRGWPLDAARGKDVIIIGGGLGVAPVRPLWRAVMAERAAFGRVNLLIGARNPAELLYPDELQQMRSHLDLMVEVTVDRAKPGWFGHVGVVTEIMRFADYDPANTVAFLCGPEIMMRFCVRELLHAGVSEADVQVSMERNMHCAVGRCGHCQLGPKFVCKDGPVFSHAEIGPWLSVAGV